MWSVSWEGRVNLAGALCCNTQLCGPRLVASVHSLLFPSCEHSYPQNGGPFCLHKLGRVCFIVSATAAAVGARGFQSQQQNVLRHFECPAVSVQVGVLMCNWVSATNGVHKHICSKRVMFLCPRLDVQTFFVWSQWEGGVGRWVAATVTSCGFLQLSAAAGRVFGFV